MAKSAAERFKKRIRGGVPHTVNKKKTVEDNPEELPFDGRYTRDKRFLPFDGRYARDKRFEDKKGLPDYTKYLAK